MLGGGAPMSGISALIKEALERFLTAFYHVSKLRAPSPDHAGTLTLEFQPSEL